MSIPSQPRLRLENIEGVWVVHLVGHQIVGDDTVEAAVEELFGLVDQAAEPRLLLSFRDVHILSSSALASLMNLERRVKDRRGALKLCALKSVHVELLRVTGLDRIFELYDDEDSAFNTF